INQGPGKITDITGHGHIDASDILAPMQLDANGNDTGLGGWAFPGNTLDGDTAHPNDFIGWNFVNNTNDPLDDNGHGTHTAGTIAEMGNNALGGTGVNRQGGIMGWKFRNKMGTRNRTAATAAVNYPVRHGPRVSNNSWGGGGFDTLLFNAINAARTTDFGGGKIGQVFVAAAGNNGTNNDNTHFYPASYNLANVLPVAA